LATTHRGPFDDERRPYEYPIPHRSRSGEVLACVNELCRDGVCSAAFAVHPDRARVRYPAAAVEKYLTETPWPLTPPKPPELDNAAPASFSEEGEAAISRIEHGFYPQTLPRKKPPSAIPPGRIVIEFGGGGHRRAGGVPLRRLLKAALRAY